jgi:hypothetical protein
VLRLPKRLRPVVQRRGVDATDADRHPVIVGVVVSFGERDTVPYRNSVPILSCQWRRASNPARIPSPDR